MRKIPLRIGVVLVAVVAAFFVAPTLPASADNVPPTQYTPVPLADTNLPGNLLSQADGGVTVGCANGSTGTKRVDSSGNVSQNIAYSPPWPNTCPRNAVVTADGTLVTMATSSNGWPFVEDIKNGSTAWSYTGFPCFVAVRGMVVGTDGNVYILYTTLTCGGQSFLLGLTPGGTSPTVVMNNVSVAGNVIDGGLAATTSGLTLRTSTGLQFVSYSGTVSSPMTITNVLSNVYQEHQDATLAGRIVVSVGTTPANQQLCGNDVWVVGGIYAFEPGGQVWGYNSLPACSHVYEIRPTPGGGAVLHYDAPQGGVVGSPRVHYLLALGADGGQLWTDSLALEPAVVDAGTTFAVDLNGNVAVQRRIRYQLNMSGTTYLFPAVRLQLIGGATGILVGSYELSGDHATSSGNGFDQFGTASVSIGHGTWYVAAENCTTANNCDNSTAKLYAVKVPGLQMDYPRGAILSPVTAKNYAALGDSYSGAEGVEPFVSGTDTAGPPENRCHRSANAYGPLLSGTPATGWTLTTVNGRSSFAACSGATTAQITGPWPSGGKNTNEPAQVDALSTSTNVVTISIGGNDVRFRDFVIDCLFRDCSSSVVSQPYFSRIGSLGTTLTALFIGTGGIHNKASNATVYDMGYPQLLPTQGCSQTDGWMALFGQLVASAHGGDAVAINAVVAIGRLGHIPDVDIYSVISAGVFEFNANEVATARSLVQQLDQAIKDTVTAINQPWLVYVDPLAAGSPFIGHELCTSQPYFNGLDAVHNEYSYHPNNLGQDAYKQLLLQQQF